MRSSSTSRRSEPPPQPRAQPPVRRWLRWTALALAALVVIAGIGGSVVWWKFLKRGDQQLADATARFEYGSLEGELVAGLPYSIFMILPRVFPDLISKYATEGYGPQKRGFGGYGAFGLAWEEGQRLPFGLSIKRLGYDRVTINCALCHTASYRLSADDEPHFAVGGPAHTLNLQGLLRFLIAVSHDERFSTARLLPEISVHFPMDAMDRLDYATVVVPATRAALRLVENQLGWMNSKPAWGPGRDDAFNLPKYILTQTPWDNTTGNTDFPAVWRLGSRKGQLYHSAGEARSLYAVVATSAIGIGSVPTGEFVERNQWLEEFIARAEPPKYPGVVEPALAERGRALYEARCGECHAEGEKRTGTAIPLQEIGTDPEHVNGWNQDNAERMNLVVRAFGAANSEVQGAQGGYVARPLVGLWLLGPYLHNGSVPTLWDLLSPPEKRPGVFYRGYDIVDFDRVGFVSAGDDAAANGYRFDTTIRGNGNGGHLYGTDLSDSDKRALIEFLKTL